MKNWFIIILLLPIVLFSCRKDYDNTTIDIDYEAPEVIVTASLSGQITNPIGQGEANVMVTVNNHTAITDANGLYQFKNISLNSRGTYVTAEKEGYFLGSDRLYPANGSINFSKITLLSKNSKGIINGSQGGFVEFDGAKISFPTNAIVDGQDNSYSGNVKVFAYWLNPLADNIQDIMPGGLFGLNLDSREVMMASLGMLAVELQDIDGNILQIASGKEVSLSFPVPQELLANAPANIPLWYFDEILGLWIEEGKATLEGGVYTGKVSHFTFWNVDVPSGVDLIFVSGCFVSPDGYGITNKRIQIIAPSNIYTYAYGMTDAEGNFSGYLPAGDLLVFSIEDGCGESYEFEIGPFEENTEMGCFEILSSSLVIISGQVVDCSNEGLGQGVIFANWSTGLQTVITNENGYFSMAFFNCEDLEIRFRFIDIENQSEGSPLTITLNDDEDFGILQACGFSIEEYVHTNVFNESYSFPVVTLKKDAYNRNVPGGENIDYHQIKVYNSDIDSLFGIYIISLDEGSYTGEDLSVGYAVHTQSNDEYIGLLHCFFNCDGMTVNITANGGPGGFLEGNFSGVIDGRLGFTFEHIYDEPLSGDFRVRIPE